MAYQPNIPQATDRLSKSQGDILGNFQALQTFVGVSLEDFASPNAGKNKFVNFVDQTGSVPASDAPNIIVYNAQDAATVQQLWINNGVDAAFPFTKATKASNGFTYLPSGIIMLWGVINPVVGNNTFTFSSISGFPAGGFPNGAFNAQVSAAGNIASVLFIPSLTPTQIVINSSNTQTLFFSVIGN